MKPQRGAGKPALRRYEKRDGTAEANADEKADATNCRRRPFTDYAQVQSRLEDFALVESNREG